MSKFENKQELVGAIKASMKKGFVKEEAENYASYCHDLKTEVKNGRLKNQWFQDKTIQELSEAFRKVKNEGLVFDGKHITWQPNGVTYDYVAYKNKMLLAYPDSKIDLSLVYQGDETSFKKVSGEVRYTHNVANPFNQEESDIIGGYCVIRNERGEFLTTLSHKELEKHRAVAKTDFIWKQWYKEMCLKTIMKKACKFHFDDIFEGIEEMDNENYELPTEEESEIDKLSKEIKEALEKYEGEDKQDIRLMCIEKYNSGELDRKFTDNILSQIK